MAPHLQTRGFQWYLRDPSVFINQKHKKGKNRIPTPRFWRWSKNNIVYRDCAIFEVETDVGTLDLVIRPQSVNSTLDITYLGGLNFAFSNISKIRRVGLIQQDTKRPRNYMRVWDLEKAEDLGIPVYSGTPTEYVRTGQISELGLSGSMTGYNVHRYDLEGGSGSGAAVKVTSITGFDQEIDDYYLASPGRNYKVGELLEAGTPGTNGYFRVENTEDDFYFGD